MRPEHEIAEAISATWHGANRAGVGHIEVPIGVVASVLVTSPHALDDLPKLTNVEFVERRRDALQRWAEVIELGTKTLRWIEAARAVEELLESKAPGEVDA